MAPTESGDEIGRDWWAPAPPQFTPDSLAWSEDEEEWLPEKRSDRGKEKGVERVRGTRPMRSYSKKDREATGKREGGTGESQAHTAIAGSSSRERVWGSQGGVRGLERDEPSKEEKYMGKGRQGRERKGEGEQVGKERKGGTVRV